MHMSLVLVQHPGNTDGEVFMTREQGNDDIFRMYYTLCPHV